MHNLQIPLEQSLPKIFKHTGVLLDGGTPIIIAAPLLNLPPVHVIPIVKGIDPKTDPDTGKETYAAVTGYTVLKKILETDPNDFYKILWEPCRNAISWIYSVDFGEGLSTLLELFEKSKFGEARVDQRDLHTLVTLSDILSLLQANLLTSDLKVRDISSPIVALPIETTLREALEVMFKDRIRRVFIKGKGCYVSSREILGFLFSPERLKIARDSPERWLDATLEDFPYAEPAKVESSDPINKASRMINIAIEDCVICEKGVATRWDFVVKSWKMNRLHWHE